MYRHVPVIRLCTLALALTGCGGSASSPAPTPTYSIGGSISGTQTIGPDGGVVNSVCDGEADVLFQNCDQ